MGVGPEAADSGIGCERCHGPGGNHQKAIAADFSDRAIVSVAGNAAAIDKQCAECHTVGLPRVILSQPDDPKYVRSPALTLTVSRCYIESAGGMSCLTCHDAHYDADRSAAFYDTRCLSCHSKQPSRDTALTTVERAPRAPAGQSTVCPVNPTKDCLSCHMPKIPVATLHMSLTDHYIRVRREKSISGPRANR
jgi:hypothetical protein